MWKDNCAKKVRSLLIPYLFWNFFWIGFELVAHLILPQATEDIAAWTITEWVGQLVFDSFYAPFWYIRMLFIMNLFAPILRKLIWKFPCFMCIVAMITWFLPLNSEVRQAVTFMLLGGELAVYLQKKKAICIKRYATAIYTIAFLVCNALVIVFSKYDWCERIGILVLTILTIVYCFSKGNDMTNECVAEGIKKMLPYTFIIYAMHGKLLSILQILLVRIIPQSRQIVVLEYFSLPFLVIGLCIYIAIVYQWLFPKLCRVSTGGRS